MSKNILITSGAGFIGSHVADGLLDPSPLYTHILPFDQRGDALRMTAERPDDFMKALVPL